MISHGDKFCSGPFQTQVKKSKVVQNHTGQRKKLKALSPQTLDNERNGDYANKQGNGLANKIQKCVAGKKATADFKPFSPVHRPFHSIPDTHR